MDALHNNGSDYVKAVYLVKDAIAVRQRTPWFWPDIVYDNLPIGKKVNQGIATMHKYAYKVSSKSTHELTCYRCQVLYDMISV